MSINTKNITSVKETEGTEFVVRESKSADSIAHEIHTKTGLRVLMITQGVSRIIEPLFNSQHQVVGVLESASRNYKKRKALHQLLSSIARKVYSTATGKNPTLKAVLKKRRIPYRFMTSSDDPGLSEWIKALKPDVIVIFSMSQLLKEKIFRIPKYGTINLHPSALPEYRGPNPDFWQYYNMEMNPGVTVHYIDQGEDTGDIIFQERMEIPLGIKSPERLDKLIGELGIRLLLRAVNAIEIGNAPRTPQPTDSPTARARNLLPDDHSSIIDWNGWPGEKVWHVLRGTELWLNALPLPKGLCRGTRWSVEDFIPNSLQTKNPGELFKEEGEYFVATRGGRIRLSCKPHLRRLIGSFIR